MRKKEEVECILRDELPSPASSSSSVTSCSGMGGGANGEISREKMKTLLTKAVTYFAYACPHTYTHPHTVTHTHQHTVTLPIHTHTHTHTFFLLFRIQFMRRGDSTLKPGGETLCVSSKEELQVVVDLVNSLVVGQHHHDVVR